MRRWGHAAGVVTAVVLTAACSPSSGARDDSAEPRLPTVVNAPGTWSDDEGVRGPVAAVGIATRNHPRGVFGEIEGLDLFTVSAIDGRATWWHPPGDALPPDWPVPAAFAVSPDGRWLAWTTKGDGTRRGDSWIAGWSIMDTASGEVRELRDPRSPEMSSPFPELAFSADSRYLTTTYQPVRPGSRGTLRRQLVAWEIATGEPTVLDEPGTREAWYVGSAPSGVVWSRGKEVFRADPATGERTSVTLPEKVTVASWGPDGSFAYADGGSSVHVGSSVEEAIEREVALPRDSPVGQSLTWQDPSHLVVGRYRPWVDRIDLISGEVERIELDGYGETFNPPDLATALWQQPLREPLDPVGTTDPRVPWRWGGLAALLLGVAYVVRRVRVTAA